VDNLGHLPTKLKIQAVTDCCTVSSCAASRSIARPTCLLAHHRQRQNIIMDQRLRQRGWSIQSASDDPSSNHQRARAESSATEPSLSHEEKVHLMNSAFDEVDDDVEIVVPTGKTRRDSESVEESENYVAMAGEEESADGDDEADDAYAKHPKKRRKTESSDQRQNYAGIACDAISNDAPKQLVTLTQVQQDQLDLAKSKLSKWAARLFDPNRPRGLVEPPKT